MKHPYTAFDWLTNYTQSIQSVIASLSEDSKEAINQLQESIELDAGYDKPVLFAGNGGSAAIADHAAVDFSKGLRGVLPVSAHSLCSNGPYITALANDMGYENVFVEQLKAFKMLDPTVVIISSSGNSRNVVKLAEYCMENDLYCTAIYGFDGGKLKELSDTLGLIKGIHIPNHNYGQVEDISMMILHSIYQNIKYKYHDSSRHGNLVL